MINIKIIITWYELRSFDIKELLFYYNIIFYFKNNYWLTFFIINDGDALIN